MERLRTLRESRGLTQADVAKILSVGKNTISRYENGEREPEFSILKKLAEYFDTSTSYIIGETDDPAPPGKTLVIPDEIQNMYFAFHRGEFEDLTQDEVDALAVIAKRFKANRKGE